MDETNTKLIGYGLFFLALFLFWALFRFLRFLFRLSRGVPKELEWEQLSEGRYAVLWIERDRASVYTVLLLYRSLMNLDWSRPVERAEDTRLYLTISECPDTMKDVVAGCEFTVRHVRKTRTTVLAHNELVLHPMSRSSSKP